MATKKSDFDGDGIAEIPVTSPWGIGILKLSGNTLSESMMAPNGTRFGGWLLNTADNRFNLMADFDGDGNAELLVTSPWGIGILKLSGNTLSESMMAPNGTRFGGWLLNTVDNRFGPVGDFDGDGKAEILVTSPWGVGVFKLAGTTVIVPAMAQNGTRVDGWLLNTTDNRFSPLGDVDGDGNDEILITSPWGIGILRLSGGAFTVPMMAQNGTRFNGWLLNTADNHVVTTADLDGDGKAEIVITSPWGIGVLKFAANKLTAQVMAQNGTRFGSWLFNSLDNRVGPAADFDGDGQVELFISSLWGIGVLKLAGNSFNMLLIAPNGTRFGGWLLNTSDNHFDNLADFTGDGKVDILVTSPWGIGIFRFTGNTFDVPMLASNGTRFGGWLLNTGDNSFEFGEQTRPVPENPTQPTHSTVVISDIHIGDNSPTCWYQQSVHEPYLLALMDWIIKRVTLGNPPIDRLIILGDLFDFWTYPPNRRPPTIDEILTANPKLFGGTGKMREVMDALNGNVLYVHGNHDINITQADLDRIPTGANKIKLVDDIYYDDDRIVYTHGHLFTMFNAPDPRFPGDVPVGHFVSRAVAYYVNSILKAGETAAGLQDQGSPYGFDLSSFIPGLSGQFSNPSITSALLDYISARTGLAEDSPIKMADGSTTCIADMKVKYDHLWTDWAARNGGGAFGATVAAKAAQADYDGSYMAWFAQMVAMQHGALGTVMGHTHKPKFGIQNSLVRYINSGFECPSTPDVNSGKTHFNFATVDSKSTLHLWQVTTKDDIEYKITSATAPEDQIIYPPFMDFSCYVRIENDTNNELFWQAQNVRYGHFVVPPPNRIPAHTAVDIWLQDLVGIHGAEGSVSYSQAAGSGSMQFTFGCPTLSPNYASSGVGFIATSGNPPTSGTTPRNQVPATGHPLFVQFLMGSPITWTPTSLLAKAVDAAGFLYDPAQDIIYSRMDPLQRQFGYAYGYDYAAFAMDAIIDCEPIFFDYAGKHWMIELWKGQYGLETGCEIGVYNRPIGSTSTKYTFLDAIVGSRPGDPNPSHNLFFDCANDTELMEMSFTLFKNGQKLFSRGPEKHWWLTGFKWGVYSRPAELTMDVSITCPDTTMRNALVFALQGMGYNVSISSTTVRFTFATPSTYQPRSDMPAIVQAVEVIDQNIVNAYNAFGFRNNDPNTIPDTAIATIMDAVAIYSWDFFAQEVANLAKKAALNAYSVIDDLVQAFGIGIDVATDLAAQAGYTFSDWVGSAQSLLGVNLDFSCIVEISNRGGPYDLILEKDQIHHGGHYAVHPPNRIGAGRVARFWLKDPKPSPWGAEGLVQYYYIDSAGNRNSILLIYGCPTGWNPNYAGANPPFNFYTKSGSTGWKGINQIEKFGHPLFVAFVYGNAPAPS